MIESTIQYKVPFKDGTVPRLNQRVRTPHGVGKIIGQDIPVGSLGNIRSTVRYYVLMDKPTPAHEDMVNNSTFKGKLCYWADELELLNKKGSKA